MKLSRCFFDSPRNYDSGHVCGLLVASDSVSLAFEHGAIGVAKDGHPMRFYAIGQKDWFEAMPEPVKQEPPPIVIPYDPPNVSADDYVFRQGDYAPPPPKKGKRR